MTTSNKRDPLLDEVSKVVTHLDQQPDEASQKLSESFANLGKKLEMILYRIQLRIMYKEKGENIPTDEELDKIISEEKDVD